MTEIFSVTNYFCDCSIYPRAEKQWMLLSSLRTCRLRHQCAPAHSGPMLEATLHTRTRYWKSTYTFKPGGGRALICWSGMLVAHLLVQEGCVRSAAHLPRPNAEARLIHLGLTANRNRQCNQVSLCTTIYHCLVAAVTGWRSC